MTPITTKEKLARWNEGYQPPTSDWPRYLKWRRAGIALGKIVPEKPATRTREGKRRAAK